MVQVKLQSSCSNTMYFDAIKGGRTSFSKQNDVLIGHVSSEEFTSFLKDNNLILYHDALKNYESGETVGHFESTE